MKLVDYNITDIVDGETQCNLLIDIGSPDNSLLCKMSISEIQELIDDLKRLVEWVDKQK